MTDTAADGAWLRSLRRAVGLCQEELAERAGLSARVIRNLERGRIEYPHPGRRSGSRMR
jgi:transcriptional regulator with XRE-family HTH domain